MLCGCSFFWVSSLICLHSGARKITATDSLNEADSAIFVSLFRFLIPTGSHFCIHVLIQLVNTFPAGTQH